MPRCTAQAKGATLSRRLTHALCDLLDHRSSSTAIGQPRSCRQCRRGVAGADYRLVWCQDGDPSDLSTNLSPVRPASHEDETLQHRPEFATRRAIDFVLRRDISELNANTGIIEGPSFRQRLADDFGELPASRAIWPAGGYGCVALGPERHARVSQKRR